MGAVDAVTDTVAEDDEHGALLIVQRSEYVPVPPGVKVAVGLDVLLKVPAPPETIDHAPVPMEGVFAARVTGLLTQVASAEPAFATVGVPLTVIVTFDDEGAQVPFEIVQLNT